MMSGSHELIEDPTHRSFDSVDWDGTNVSNVDIATALPPLEDIVRDLGPDDGLDPAITVASLVQPAMGKRDDFNFTTFLPIEPESSTSPLTPLGSAWTIFPIVFATTFLVGQYHLL